MTRTLHLTITTPSTVLVDRTDISAVRAEDASGGFGILPGHTELLTVLPASVVRWRAADGVARFCAVRSGVLTVSRGRTVAIACRQGVIGDDLAELEAQVQAMRADETDADRRARGEQVQLHARVVRQMMRYLHPGELPEPTSPEPVRRDSGEAGS